MSCHVVTLCSPCARPCPLVAPRTWNAVDGRLTLHTASPHGVSHEITGPKTAPYRPGANDSTTFKGAIWIVVASAGTMSDLTGYAGQIRRVELNPWRDDFRVVRDTPKIPLPVPIFGCNRLISPIDLNTSALLFLRILD